MDVVLPLSDCEPVRDALIAQPVNAATALAYVVAAVWLFRRTRTSTLGSLANGYAAAVAAVGVGSVLYHGPAGAGAAVAHDAALVGLAVVVVAVAAIAWRRRTAGPGPAGWLGAGALAVAVPFQVWGRTAGPLCRDGAVPAHGIWHVLTAVALAAFGAAVIRMTATQE